MIDLFEQGGHGRFDPSTFGLWLRVDRALEHPRFEEWGALMWESFLQDPHDGHRAYLQAAPEEDLELVLPAFSLYAHESRHFHDLLATPYGSALMRTATNAALGYVSVADELLYGYRGIMVPLSDWVDHGPLLRGALPELSKPSPRAERTAALWRRLSEMLEAFDGNRWDPDGQMPRARGILESSAMLHQERHLAINYGLEAAERLRKLVLAGPAARLYYSAALAVDAAGARRGTQPDTSVVSLVLLAALCGDWHGDGSLPQYPAELHMRLVGAILDGRLDGALGSSADAWAALGAAYEELQEITLERALTSAAQANEDALAAFAETVEGLEEEWEQESEEGRRLLAQFADFAAAARQVSAAMIEDPRWYVGPYGHDAPALPAPMLFLESEQGIPLDDYLREHYAIVVSGEPRGGQMGMATFTEPEELQAILRGERLVEGVSTRPLAHVLSPLDERGGPVALDLDLWRAVHADLGSIRFVSEGPGRGVSSHVVQRELTRYGVLGTAVHTSAGQLPVPLPSFTEGLDDDARAYVEDLRRRKRAQEPWSDLWWAADDASTGPGLR